jgi:hypothetical protein
MPIDDESFVSFQAPKANLPLTQPHPFGLHTEERGVMHSTQFQVKVDEEFQKEAEQRKFKAQPFVKKTPFEPVRSTKPLTEINEVILNSDLRAVKRQAWDNENMEKQRTLEEMKKQQELLRQERERRENEEYRRRLEFKANPVKHTRPFHLKPSMHTLTEPKSPMLHTKRRLAMRDL